MTFTDPIPGPFVYAAWSVEPRFAGPWLRPSPARAAVVAEVARLASQLESREGVVRARVLETAFAPPMPGRPGFDVLLLVNGVDGVDLVRTVTEGVAGAGLPDPALVCGARNAARIGDTDGADGPVLLNHFVSRGRTPQDQAVRVWSHISAWYESVLGVNNSTLVAFSQPGPYLLMNYAVVPGPVPAFMAGQLFRPSFYRRVATRLNRAGLRPIPVFARRVR